MALVAIMPLKNDHNRGIPVCSRGMQLLSFNPHGLPAIIWDITTPPSTAVLNPSLINQVGTDLDLLSLAFNVDYRAISNPQNNAMPWGFLLELDTGKFENVAWKQGAEGPRFDKRPIRAQCPAGRIVTVGAVLDIIHQYVRKVQPNPLTSPAGDETEDYLSELHITMRLHEKTMFNGIAKGEGVGVYCLMLRDRSNVHVARQSAPVS